MLKDYGNIVCRDAVLEWDRVEFVADPRGVPVTRWDGRTMKRHPVTGEDVPDETARIPVERYVNPRQAAWPDAEFVVGNPPFLGKGESMRKALGDGYVEALRAAWREVPESADFVMVWWHHAATRARRGALRRFGLITTNSLRQTFNRRVVAAALLPSPNPLPAGGERALSLAFAIPDHPWVDSADGAAVRIAMTVGSAGAAPGRHCEVIAERESTDDEIAVSLRERIGLIHADLSVGADVTRCAALQANEGITSMGVLLAGSGFLLKLEEAAALGLGSSSGLDAHVRDYRSGRDLTDSPRGLKVIDLFGLSADEVREQYPAIYQHVLEHVKPERDQNNRPSYRNNWWIFAEPRRGLRRQLDGLTRYIATVETTKHRVFRLLATEVLLDHTCISIAVSESDKLGVLTSRVHVAWALAAGSRLGIGNDPRYNKSRCFDPFPFPATTAEQQARIATLAEAIDAHRKRQQAAHPGLTLTGMYNVLDQLRRGVALTAREKAVHEQGLVSVLASLHDELDTCVLEAYGWSDLAPALVGKPGGTLPCEDASEEQQAAEAELLSRLVALNAERAAEEARGLVRWLRPEFQNPANRAAQPQPRQVEAELADAEDIKSPASPAKKATRKVWPAELPAQMRALSELLAAARGPQRIEDIAAAFTGRGPWKTRLPQLLDTLVAIGQVRAVGGGWLSAR